MTCHPFSCIARTALLMCVVCPSVAILVAFPDQKTSLPGSRRAGMDERERLRGRPDAWEWGAAKWVNCFQETRKAPGNRPLQALT